MKGSLKNTHPVLKGTAFICHTFNDVLIVQTLVEYSHLYRVKTKKGVDTSTP